MNRDLLGAGFLLIGGSAFALWLLVRRRGQQVPTSVSVSGEGLLQSPLDRLLSFARARGLRVTSTTGGRHVPGSMHYRGRAIDVSVRGLSEGAIEGVMAAARAAGFRVLDERTRHKWSPAWSGPHLHIELPE